MPASAAAALGRGFGRLSIGDQARATAVCGEADRPANEDDNAILESHEVPDMDEQPGDPCDKATQPQPADVRDSGRAADRREVALVAIGTAVAACRAAGRVPTWPRSGPLASRRARLREGRGARRRLPRTRTMSPSAKTSGCPGSVKSGSTVTRPGAVEFGAAALGELGGERRRRDAGGPDDGSRGIRSRLELPSFTVTPSASTPTTVRSSRRSRRSARAIAPPSRKATAESS